MNEIMLPVRPKWCELIASGKKTIEARKTIPKCDVPFKVYIYCTKPRMPVRHDGTIVMFDDDLAITNRFGRGKRVENPYGALMEGEFLLNGAVMGEFVCDKCYSIHVPADIQFSIDTGIWSPFSERILHYACLTPEEVIDYAGDRKYIFGWHISNLKIYDKPKQLSEFGVKRPPQSFCYVERGDKK